MTSSVKSYSKFMTLLCAILGVASVQVAIAQPGVQLKIQSVAAAYLPSGSPDYLMITGVNFGSVPGMVTLNGAGQTVKVWTPAGSW
ncbi:MAG: hypothetical protein IT165_34340 [Bryobacterales bacterium]|nr:hypothetical protein [Bryobacterales bacterium]